MTLDLFCRELYDEAENHHWRETLSKPPTVVDIAWTSVEIRNLTLLDSRLLLDTIACNVANILCVTASYSTAR